MKVDLHNHTMLCNHAEGTQKEYIEAAIEKGTDIFGFSDHAPMDFDTKYRMSFEQKDEYEESVRRLAKEYEGIIDIRLGYEVDYLEGHMDQRVLDAKVDYLIGSVHFLDKWGFDNPEFLSQYKERDIDEIWEEYFYLVTKMAQSGDFDIVGHIDLIKVFQFLPKKEIMHYVTPALEAIKEAGMSIELNTAGFRKPCKEPYPSKEILKKAFTLKIPVTFGSDAHKPTQVGMFTDEIESLAKEIGYTECVVYKNREMEFISF